MTTQSAFEIQSDPVRNLIRISYHGHVTAAAAKLLTEQAGKLLPQMRPGFTLLTDLTGLESMDLGCVPHVTGVMKLCKARGIGSTIRVIPDPRKDIGLTILANIRYGTTVQIVTCQTMAEAEAAMQS
jgi:anti-anti-sigma regulatory factor